MVWVLNCSFKISTSTVNFKAEFNILHSSFRIHSLESVFTLVFKLLNSTFLFDLVRCTFSTRQTNFYTLLLFISFDAWTSTLHLTETPILHSILTRRMLPVTVRNFKLNVVYFQLNFLNFCLRFSDHWSKQKKSLWGWEMATYRPPPPALSLGNTPPQAKILLALLKYKAF